MYHHLIKMLMRTCPPCQPRPCHHHPRCWQSSWSGWACGPRGRTPWGWTGPARTSCWGRVSLPWNCSSRIPAMKIIIITDIITCHANINLLPVLEPWRSPGICQRATSEPSHNDWEDIPWGCCSCPCWFCPTQTRWGSTCRLSGSRTRE